MPQRSHEKRADATDERMEDWEISSQAPNRGRFDGYSKEVGASAPKKVAPARGEDIALTYAKA